MWRRLRWVLLALLVAVVAAAVTAVIVEKPTLDDREEAVDTRWADLRAGLEPRYESLAAAVGALEANGEGERAVTVALRDELAAWTDSLDGGSARRQAEVAVQVEGQARRLQANVLASARLARTTELTDAIAEFNSAAPADEQVQAYNRAVRRYEDARTDTFRRPVALVFGFDSRPLFTVPS